MRRSRCGTVWPESADAHHHAETRRAGPSFPVVFPPTRVTPSCQRHAPGRTCRLLPRRPLGERDWSEPGRSPPIQSRRTAAVGSRYQPSVTPMGDNGVGRTARHVEPCPWLAHGRDSTPPIPVGDWQAVGAVAPAMRGRREACRSGVAAWISVTPDVGLRVSRRA